MTTGPWWPPFEGITERQRWTRVRMLLVVLLASGAAMLLVWPDSPGDIVAFEKAGDSGAPAFLAAWTGWDGWRAALAIVLDLPFLIAYGFGLALVLEAFARSVGPRLGWFTTFLRWCAWVPLVAAAFDVLEDLALLVVIAGHTETWPDLAEQMAAVKFGLLYVGVPVVAAVALLAGLATLLAAAVDGAVSLARWFMRFLARLASLVAVVTSAAAILSAVRTGRGGRPRP